jgi:excisionase family DNA binding protein
MPPKPKAQTQGIVTHPLDTEIYTTADVAQALKVSVRLVLNAIERGDLEARKAGKQYLITREAVRKFWEGLPKTCKPGVEKEQYPTA